MDASEELSKADRETVLAAVADNGCALEHAAPDLKADREIVLAAVADDGCAFQYASEELKMDKDFVLAAVAKSAEAFEYAAPDLKADRDFVLAAVAKSGGAFDFAAEELKADKDTILAAVAITEWALDSAGELKADRDFVLAAVAKNGYALKHAAEELRADKDIILAAVEAAGTWRCLWCASLGVWASGGLVEELLKDPAFLESRFFRSVCLLQIQVGLAGRYCYYPYDPENDLPERILSHCMETLQLDVPLQQLRFDQTLPTTLGCVREVHVTATSA